MRDLGIPTSARVATLIALTIACKAPKERVAMDYIHECRPGASAYQCIALRPKGARLFPAGRLEGYAVVTDQVVKRENFHIVQYENNQVFLHMMSFKFGRADVFDVLRAELGEPDGHYEPGHSELPIQTYGGTSISSDYWRTEDGYWICQEDYEDGDGSGLKSVYWVSNPFPVDPKATDISVWERGVDRYVRPAPKAAAIWDKLGRTLIGSAPAPK